MSPRSTVIIRIILLLTFSCQSLMAAASVCAMPAGGLGAGDVSIDSFADPARKSSVLESPFVQHHDCGDMPANSGSSEGEAKSECCDAGSCSMFSCTAMLVHVTNITKFASAVSLFSVYSAKHLRSPHVTLYRPPIA